MTAIFRTGIQPAELGGKRNIVHLPRCLQTTRHAKYNSKANNRIAHYKSHSAEIEIFAILANGSVR
jgi:hypothetical protein